MDPSTQLVPALFDLGSGSHWIIILVVALLLFGRRLPEIMRSLGGSIREFKKGMDTDQGGDHSAQPPVDGAVSRQAVAPPEPPPAAPLPQAQAKEEPVQDPTKPH